jgi:hypothetical protein
MIKTSLEFAPGTHADVKRMAQAVPPYDLLKAYREATVKFGVTDIVLLIALSRGEVINFEAWPRQDWMQQAMNDAARKTHPVARASAHKKMKMPASSPAFWIIFELDKQHIIPCAVGTYQYDDTTTGELAS